MDSIVQNRKHFQRNKMLGIIRFGEDVSRFDIKKHTSYSMTTVLNMIDELISKGYVYEEECAETRVGRKPVWLRINPKGGYFIGIEFNGRELHCDMLDFSGEVIYKTGESMNRKDSRESIINKIVNHIERARGELGERKDKILGIGIGVPGYINKTEGIAQSYSYFDDWEEVPIRELVEKRVGIPCYIENDVNVMAFAYKWFYFNGDCEDFVFLSIRMGARMVPVINNQLIFSNSGFSGEIGHVKIASNQSMCTCGEFGCLNTAVSDFAISSKIVEGIRIGRFMEIRHMVQGDMEAITIKTFVESVLQGHRDSVILMKETARYLGKALGFTVNILAPRKIIIYGELSKIGNPFFEEVKKNIESSVIKENIKGFSVCPSEPIEDLGAIGAAALVMQEQFDFIDQKI